MYRLRRDEKWELVEVETKKELDLIEKGDGEFWMEFSDFCRHFQEITICTLGPDLNNDNEPDKNGKVEANTSF